MRSPENRRYVIVKSVDLGFIDFSEVLDDLDHLRYSLDGTQFILKYNGLMPRSISSLSVPPAEFTHSEILSELANDFWQPDIDPV